jgi:hypothetical protein
MPKITSFPKTISVKINKEDGNNHFLSADTDPVGLPFAEDGERVKVGVYNLDHIREVTLTAESAPLRKQPR